MNETTILLSLIALQIVGYTIICLMRKEKKKLIDDLNLEQSLSNNLIEEIEILNVDENILDRTYLIRMSLEERENYLNSFVFLYD